MEVELPVKRVMNLPAKVVLLNDPKQKLKLTMYMPKIAYARAKSKPGMRRGVVVANGVIFCYKAILFIPIGAPGWGDKSLVFVEGEDGLHIIIG